MSKEEAKEVALVTAVIIHEDVFMGSVYQTFDKAYDVASKFVEKYPPNTHWDDLEYDETIVAFAQRFKP